MAIPGVGPMFVAVCFRPPTAPAYSGGEPLDHSSIGRQFTGVTALMLHAAGDQAARPT
jgi:hypothetical protein